MCPAGVACPLDSLAAPVPDSSPAACRTGTAPLVRNDHHESQRLSVHPSGMRLQLLRLGTLLHFLLKGLRHSAAARVPSIVGISHRRDIVVGNYFPLSIAENEGALKTSSVSRERPVSLTVSAEITRRSKPRT